MKQKNKLKCEFCGEEMEWNKAHICNNHTQKQRAVGKSSQTNISKEWGKDLDIQNPETSASADFKENEFNLSERKHNKTIKHCSLCGLEKNTTRSKNHHIVPRRLNKSSHIKIWLCHGCHMVLHKAEQIGIIKFPSSNEEYQKWKLVGDELK